MNKFFYLFMMFAAIFASDVKAAWVSVHNEYNFGPEMSAIDACQKAERRAEEKALKAVTGKKFLPMIIWSALKVKIPLSVR